MSPLIYVIGFLFTMLLGLIGFLLKDKLKTIETRIDNLEEKLDTLRDIDHKIDKLLDVLDD